MPLRLLPLSIACCLALACDKTAEPGAGTPPSAPPAEASAGTVASAAAASASITSATPSGSAAASAPALPVKKRVPKERDRYTVRFSEDEGRAVLPAKLEEAKLERVQEAQLVVTCLAVSGTTCSRSELTVKGHKPKKSLIDNKTSMRLADAYTIEGAFAPANLSKHGEKLEPEEESALTDLANIVGRMSLQSALPDEVRVGDKLPRVASAFRSNLPGGEVDARVTAVDLAAGTFTHVVTTSMKSNQEGIVASLDMTLTVTTSAATGLPVGESSVAKMFTSYKGVSPKGEEATSISRRTATIEYELR